MRTCFILMLLVSLVNNGLAQRTCSTDFISQPSSVTGMHMREMISDEVITIPVVVHILYNNSAQNISDERVLSQIEALNRDFSMSNADISQVPAAFRMLAADTRIQFCLAKSDPLNRLTTGIVRKSTQVSSFTDESMKFSAAGGSDAWDTRRYLNIWVCNLFGRSLGFATFPGGSADRDGVVINFDVFGTGSGTRSPFNMGRTATHEVAHWLGLKHIWGDSFCGSDDVGDTPQQEGSNYNCPTFPRLSSCSPNALGDMFMNYMDLSDDACMLMFTNGQKARMRSVFAAGGFREQMLNSNGCMPGSGTAGPVPGETPDEAPAIEVMVKAYPNPFVQYFQLESSAGKSLRDQVISMYDAHGKLILRQTATTEVFRVDAMHLASGIYIVRIGDGKIFPSIKLMKQ